MKKSLRGSTQGILIMTKIEKLETPAMSIITEEMIKHIYEAISAMNQGVQMMHERLTTQSSELEELKKRLETLEKKLDLQ